MINDSLIVSLDGRLSNASSQFKHLPCHLHSQGVSKALRGDVDMQIGTLVCISVKVQPVSQPLHTLSLHPLCQKV